MKIDMGRLEALADMMEQRDLVEVELADGDTAMMLELAPPKARKRAQGSEESEDRSVTVTSSRVGIFLKRVSVGDQVAEGGMLAELRVMDVKYRVSSPTAGTVEEIFVEDGMGVEYGQPLLKLMPPGASAS